jgi:transketolase
MNPFDLNSQKELAKLIRYYILICSTTAGTGHPTSSLSAVEIMTNLMFGGFFKTDLDDPKNIQNDRLIFSKGHASPLFYGLYAACGVLSEKELLTFRQFDSVLEGHPTPRFKFTEATTGSLGQGLGIAVGMALAAKTNKLDYKTFVLLGDSELAEGSVWEAINSASYYKLNNLVAIVDMNRLGQRGQTQLGHDTNSLRAKTEAFGLETFVVDGHNLEEINQTFQKIQNSNSEKPKMIIAKTFKGAGISFLENKDNWHGKALNQEECKLAIAELGKINKSLKGEVAKLDRKVNNLKEILEQKEKLEITEIKFKNYSKDQQISTRKAYGDALVSLGECNSEVVVLDAEMNNSTFSNEFANKFPEKYFEMFIAEQNMVSVASGLSIRGFVPFVSTFAAFLTRSFDQIRMAQYSNINLNIMGSHCGVSIGPDGPSQMGLEDVAMFRTIHNSVVLYPSDGVSCQKLVLEMLKNNGINYLRGTRADLPIIYEQNEEFKIGGSKTLKSSEKDEITILAAGITLFEALKAHKELLNKNIKIRIIDLYSIKPLDLQTIVEACKQTKAIITVEDHYAEGGIFGAVCQNISPNLAEITKFNPNFKGIYSLAVNKISRSGTPNELLEFMEIDAKAIVNKVLNIL